MSLCVCDTESIQLTVYLPSNQTPNIAQTSTLLTDNINRFINKTDIEQWNDSISFYSIIFWGFLNTNKSDH